MEIYFDTEPFFSAATLLSKIKTVDGPGSGLDADKLDGQEGAYYLPVSSYNAADVLNKIKTVHGAGSGLDADLLDGLQLSDIQALINAKLNIASYTAADILAKIITVDGVGSGLDADLLDGQQGAYYLPAASYTAADVLNKIKTVHGPGSGLNADLLDGNQASAFVLVSDYENLDVLNKIKAVHGAGSGLDADLLDGNQSSAFVFASEKSVTSGASKVVQANGSGKIDPSYNKGDIEWETIASETIAQQNAVNNFVFSNLNGDNDIEYKLEYDLILPSNANDRYLQLKPNNDGGNAVEKKLELAGTGNNGAGTDDKMTVGIAQGNNEGDVWGKFVFKAKRNGKHRRLIGRREELRSSNVHFFTRWSDRWTNTTDNLTSLVLAMNYGSFYGDLKLKRRIA